MKKIVNFIVPVCLGLFLFVSCKENGGGRAMLQSITGSTNELMVVMPKLRKTGRRGRRDGKSRGDTTDRTHYQDGDRNADQI